MVFSSLRQLEPAPFAGLLTRFEGQTSEAFEIPTHGPHRAVLGIVAQNFGRIG
jgi:hypothetical protein